MADVDLEARLEGLRPRPERAPKQQQAAERAGNRLFDDWTAGTAGGTLPFGSYARVSGPDVARRLRPAAAAASLPQPALPQSRRRPLRFSTAR
jgi:hypothetical protein